MRYASARMLLPSVDALCCSTEQQRPACGAPVSAGRASFSDDYDWRVDADANYRQGLAAIRLALVMRGEAEPLEDEPIDLILMATLGR